MNRSVLSGFLGGLLAIGLVSAAPALQDITVSTLGWAAGGGSPDIRMSRTESAGSPILNMQISGTTVATLTANGLTVDDIALDNIKTGDGTAAAPSYSFTSDPDTGFYNVTGDSLGVSTGGTVRATFTSAGMALTNAAGPDILNETASATNPTLVPNRADPNTGIGWTTTDHLALIAGGVSELSLVAGTAQFATTTNLIWTTDDDSDIGASGATRPQTIYVGTSVDSQRYEVSNDTEGNTASMNIKSATDTVTLTGATTDSTTISIPSGAMVFGCSFTVNTAVVDSAGDDTWSAAFITGDTSTLATAAAPTQNTKVNTLVAPAITNNTTQVRFTPQGGNFSAGVIEMVCYFIDTTGLANV